MIVGVPGLYGSLKKGCSTLTQNILGDAVSAIVCGWGSRCAYLESIGFAGREGCGLVFRIYPCTGRIVSRQNAHHDFRIPSNSLHHHRPAADEQMQMQVG
jgi:hypothetical protein